MTIKPLLILGVLLAFLAYKVHKVTQPPPLPEAPDENKWWGPGNPGRVNKAIRTFEIDVPDNILEDLKWRLENHRTFTKTLEGVQQQYGINNHLLQKFVDYWKTDYKWKEREAILNKYPHYRTVIQGLGIHFVHVKPVNPENKTVLPIVLLNGWPSSIVEFIEVIPILTTPDDNRDFVFEVVVPSIPGYIFSDGASKPGLGPPEIAVIIRQLMERLGFPKFYAHSTDFGALILQTLAVLSPDSFLGYHSNLCSVLTPLSYLKIFLGTLYPKWITGEEHVHRIYPIGKEFELKMREFGYMHLQATKPDSIGIALNDSPVGLAAYILEKFTSATNVSWEELEDGGLPGPYTMDSLLDNIMLFWLSNSITTSMRLYAETLNKDQLGKGILRNPVVVPTACGRFSNEVHYPADGLIGEIFKNLVQVRDLEGGHFAAMQLPTVVAGDLIDAVEKFEKLRK